MRRRAPRWTRTYTLLPYTTLVRADPGPRHEARPGTRSRAGQAGPGRPGTGSRGAEPGGAVRRHAEARRAGPRHRRRSRHRSEEHTSELQSLMRPSYAVFCLTKTKTTKNSTIHIPTPPTITSI